MTTTDSRTGLLAEEQIERYSRQLILKQWGSKQQACLSGLTASVPCSLKSAAVYLAAAGIGRIILFGSSEAQTTLQTFLAKLNPDCTVVLADASAEPTEITVEGPGFGRVKIYAPLPSSNALRSSSGKSQTREHTLKWIPESLYTGILAAGLVLREVAEPTVAE